MKSPRITSILVATAVALSSGAMAAVIAPSAVAAVNSVATSTVTAPVFKAQPRSTTAYAGQTARFSVTVAGTGLSYNWQAKIVGKNWARVAGTRSTLNVMATPSRDKAQYRVIVRGHGGQVISKSATLTVVTPRPRITSQPHSTSVTAGQAARFTASGTGYGVSYKWQWKPTGATWQTLPGATHNSYGFTAKTAYNGFQFRVVLRNAAGTVTSKAAKLVVKSTRTDPVKVGTSVRLKDWQANMEVTNTNAWSRINANLTDPVPPASGHRYVAAFSNVRYVGSGSADPLYDLDVEFVGGNGHVYRDTNKLYWTNDRYAVGELFHNATGKFATIVEVPVSAIAGGKWRITDSSNYPWTIAWFALS